MQANYKGELEMEATEHSSEVPRWQLRSAAVFEVVAVLVGGSLLARWLSGWLGLARSRELINALPEGATPDFLNWALISGLDLLIKYGIMLGLAVLIGWWHRRRRWSAYGLSLAGRTAGQHVGSGVLLFAVAAFLPTLLTVINHYVPLGAGPEHWSVFSYGWSLEFWVFMAVSSFVLVPILEELFIRGYVQTRLIEDYGVGGGIVIAAFVFAFSHTQYFRLTVMSQGMLFSILLASIAMGYVFYRTRSLVPVVLAHGLLNTPTRHAADVVLLAVMLPLFVVSSRQIAGYARSLWQELVRLRAGATLGALALFAVTLLALMLVRPLILVWVATAGAITLIVEYRDRQARETAAQGRSRRSLGIQFPGDK
ncbi:MAG: CPBP family intramembrane metalloprotease [Gemmatimonadota bacterium]|nr:MAG: CPBP family intramembrane metalloprotease [Gemmatimonadota bacterium]